LDFFGFLDLKKLREMKADTFAFISLNYIIKIYCQENLKKSKSKNPANQ